MVRKTFPHTPDEAMSGGLAKACDLRKKSILLKRNQVASLKIKQNEKSTCIYQTGVWSGKYFPIATMGKIGEKNGRLQTPLEIYHQMLKDDIIPVSVRLKTNIHTTKGLDIIRRAEKQLLNECIRSINKQLEMFMLKKDTCTIK